MNMINVENYIYHDLLPNMDTEHIRKELKNNKTLTSIYIESYMFDMFINEFEYTIEKLYGKLYKFIVDIYDGRFAVLIHFKDLDMYNLDQNKFENNIYNILGYNETINFNYSKETNSLNITFFSEKLDELYNKTKEKLLQKLESLQPCTDNDRLWDSICFDIRHQL